MIHVEEVAEGKLPAYWREDGNSNRNKGHGEGVESEQSCLFSTEKPKMNAWTQGPMEADCEHMFEQI